ncbi:adenosylcobinamide-GDP ribazoletransferase [Metabacillus idriensis]|uniref:adenosylcobinamide-GDP ribazoletransferase n=1 Tax=Metabacillus idriensis TaxID=324768 RepID=UPI00174E1DC3|nr:adenosylcobinamide-GDP ribazoletransferase [Metabacillus idriensis]MCM3595719.1 adenosylcobinamide-GDP ribazoletransferase [Metabacillus idriensis]
MKKMMYGAILALQFLTRIPLPVNCPMDHKTLKWALRFYPFAGFAIGGTLYLVYYLLNGLLPLYMLTLILLTLWVFLSGGLHLDGVMDVADAVGSNGSTEKKIEILKDSRAGSFAVLSAVFLLLWKSVLLYAVLEVNENILFLLAIPMMARFQALLQLFLFHPFQNKGMAHYWKQHLSKRDVIIAACLLLPFAAFPVTFSIMFCLQICFSYIFGKWAVRQFQGINGDTVGASIEGAELWNLAVLYSLFLFGMV